MASNKSVDLTSVPCKMFVDLTFRGSPGFSMFQQVSSGRCVRMQQSVGILELLTALVFSAADRSRRSLTIGTIANLDTFSQTIILEKFLIHVMKRGGSDASRLNGCMAHSGECGGSGSVWEWVTLDSAWQSTDSVLKSRGLLEFNVDQASARRWRWRSRRVCRDAVEYLCQSSPSWQPIVSNPGSFALNKFHVD